MYTLGWLVKGEENNNIKERSGARDGTTGYGHMMRREWGGRGSKCKVRECRHGPVCLGKVGALGNKKWKREKRGDSRENPKKGCERLIPGPICCKEKLPTQ